MDPRYHQLAKNLLGFSCAVKAGENVMIDAHEIPDDMVVALIRAVREAGAHPFVTLAHNAVTRELLRGATQEQFEYRAKIELEQMKGMHAYIAFRGSDNIFETSDVPADKMKLAMGLMRPVQNQRVNHTRWVVLRWPSAAMAQLAARSTEDFTDFFFRVCNQDYSRFIPGMEALKKAMEKTDKVHIKGPGTDLRFSIKNIAAIPCGGSCNIPDGEVFTAPVRDSVEGVITYNAPAIYQGVSFDGIRLRFSKGKIVEATCSGDNKRLNAIFDSDEGARYVGEFAIGFNPHILEPMRDTLFDEKIAGSFHFTPGQCYETTDNGNKSQVHWDLVSIQRPEHGGGEIWFDNKLVRKDGLFVVDELKALNPDQLLAPAAPKKKAKSAAKKAAPKSATRRPERPEVKSRRKRGRGK